MFYGHCTVWKGFLKGIPTKERKFFSHPDAYILVTVAYTSIIRDFVHVKLEMTLHIGYFILELPKIQSECIFKDDFLLD